MKTAHRLGGLLVGLFLVWGCSSSRSASVTDDTYLTARQRASLSQQKAKASSSSEVDARDDNFERADRSGRSYGEEDYCYGCRVRRYSTGVWYDPWMAPWCGWGSSAWMGPGWGAWGPGWYSPGWTFSWGDRWGYPRSWYTPGWGWPYYYAGSGWYYDPYWGYWGSYGAPLGGGSTSTSRPRTYVPRTYTTPSGSTTYTPPRGGVISTSPTPPRRTAAPSRPDWGSGAGGGGYVSPSSGGRSSMSGGSTSGGGIRSSGGGGARPR